MALPNGNEVQKQLIDSVAKELHSGEYFKAAELVASWVSRLTGAKVSQVSKKAEADALLTILLHWCLDNGGYTEAAQLLWTPTQFDPRPSSAQRVWKGFENNPLVMLMGAGSMSKSYSMGVRLMLEWVRDPEYTTVQVLGPSEDHLEKNLFSHLVSLHQSAAIPLPGKTGKLFIGLDTKNKKSSITGVVIPIGKKSAGRLQGSKRIQRQKPHPVFGITSRMFIFLDEIANIPVGIWKDIDNLMTNMGEGILKIVAAFNPDDMHHEVGKRCEPEIGWDKIDADKDFEWTSRRGWFVVRLDGHQCENVLEDRVIYTGLQTREGLRMLARSSGGTDSAGYWTMGRGMFPPAGVSMTIIPSGMLADFKAEILWYERPVNIAGVDTALQGKDASVFAKGCYGMATGIRFPASPLEPNGRSILFKNARGINILRPMILVESFHDLPKGDTVKMANAIIKMANQLHVRPEALCMDKTGHGKGVFDLCVTQFGDVLGVNFSESCSKTKIMAEDKETADEVYDRIYSELWFALRKFIEFGYLKISFGVETEPLYTELSDRRFRTSGKKTRAEEKEDYCLRHQDKSPDHADAISLIVQLVRQRFNLIPGMVEDATTSTDPNEDSDEFNDMMGGCRIDITNRTDTLD